MKLHQAITMLTAIVGAEAMNEAKKAIVNQTIFLPKSCGNAKVGFMTSTYSPRTTCPNSCPFKACGACYAEHGKCKMWFNVAGGGTYRDKHYHINISQLKEKLHAQATTNLIRHNVSGDLCTGNSCSINPALVATLIDAYAGHKAYTYTHAPASAENLAIIKAACKAGFVINKSCENMTQVKQVIAAGAPAVLAVDTMKSKKAVIDGVELRRCPATIDGTGATCASCKLCANAKRKCVVVFPVHGPAANNARKAGFLTNI